MEKRLKEADCPQNRTAGINSRNSANTGLDSVPKRGVGPQMFLQKTGRTRFQFWRKRCTQLQAQYGQAQADIQRVQSTQTQLDPVQFTRTQSDQVQSNRTQPGQAQSNRDQFDQVQSDSSQLHSNPRDSNPFGSNSMSSNPMGGSSLIQSRWIQCNVI